MNDFLALGDFNAVSEVDSSCTGASSTSDLFYEQEKKGSFLDHQMDKKK